MKAMDDDRLDNSIKEKLGDYEAPGFDPSALAAFHHQLASATVWPWYSHYRTELITCAAVIGCTLLILGSQWYWNSRTLNAEIAGLAAQKEEIVQLRHELEYWKNHGQDTIRIIEIREQPSSSYQTLLRELARMRKLISTMAGNDGAYSPLTESPGTAPQDLSAGEGSTTGTSMPEYGYPASGRLIPRKGDVKNVRAQPRDFIMSSEVHRKLSVNALRDLKKHYQKGVGIKLGPVLELSHGMYTHGNGRADLTGGILADLTVSPSLSLETGVQYTHRFYEISGKEKLSGIALPGVDSNLGALTTADVDSWILEVPVNLKYSYPVSMKTQWLGGIGYSSLLCTRQALEYNYELEGNASASVTSSYRTTGSRLYAGALNFSLGVSHQLKNKKILETSLYYQHGLGEFGVEQTSARFLGIKGVYWFTIR